MTIQEMLSTSTLHATRAAPRYLLRAINPETGETHDGRYLTMKAALTKLAELLPDECAIEIWSSSSLESHARPRPTNKHRRTDRQRKSAGSARSHGAY
jgi:hypothetical protein